jgi:hypothetical protein
MLCRLTMGRSASGTALPEDLDFFATARVTLDGQPKASVRHAAPVMARAHSDA